MTAATAFLCKTCGTQFPPSLAPPESCPICQDERQFVGHHGQEWTTVTDLRDGHRNVIGEEEPGLHSFLTEPSFAIGQRAFLVQTAQGNLLWDCVALLNEETIEAIKQLGGIRAIAVSHPHYYTTMIDWSRQFGNAPIFIHELDRQWVVRPNDNVTFWSGERRELFGGLRLVWTGGHFDGYQVAHWTAGANGRGVLLAGDQPQVCLDRDWVSFMYSYPNYIPLGKRAVTQVVERLEQLPFDRIYGAFRTVAGNAKTAVEKSAKRFLQAIDS
jgi:hypothetical protein